MDHGSVQTNDVLLLPTSDSADGFRPKGTPLRGGVFVLANTLLGAGMLGRTLQPMQWLMLGAIALGAYLAADHSEQSGGLGSVARGVASGLSYLHDHHSLLHGDIKSANVLVSRALDTIKLCDLGASRETGDAFCSEATMTMVSGVIYWWRALVNC